MITSTSNPWFRRVRAAVREHGDEIVVEGPKAVADAITAGWKPLAVIGGPDSSSPLVTTIFSRELFHAVAGTKTSQGVIGLFERPVWSASQILGRRDTIAVALDAVQDPGNVGTIVRLAAAFDAAGVILLPGTADPYGPKAIRASAGAILHVPVAPMSAGDLLASGIDLWAADAAAEHHETPVRGGAIVFGGEGSGVSPAIRQKARRISVATAGRVESLNVAAAAAILLWQSFRARTR